MKRVLLIGGGVVVVLIAAAAVVPFFIPKDVYRSQIETAAQNALGREVTLAGDLGIGVFPRISASVSDVTVANPEGFSDPDMVEAGALRASVQWLPLLSGKVEVQELAFIDSMVRLERLADGRANWEFETDTPAATPAPEEGGRSTGGLNAGVGRARLVNATITYKDAVAGQAYELAEFSVEGSMASLDDELRADGAGRFDGQPFEFDVRLNSPNAILAGEEAAIALDFSSDLATLSFDGDVTFGDLVSATGAFSLAAPDLAALAAYAGVEAPIELQPLGGFEAKGSVAGPPDALAITFDTLSQTGDLIAVTYKGGVVLTEDPSVDGAFSLRSADLGRLAAQLGVEADGLSALEAIDVSGAVSGPVSAIAISALSANHRGDLLTAAFDGSLALGGSGAVTGALSAGSDDLRGLLAAAGVELTPGETLRRFSIRGDLSGDFETVSVADLEFELDDLAGRGSVGAALGGARPKATADIAMERVDLSAFLGESEETPEGWPTEPLDLAALKMADADIRLRAGALIVGAITLTDAETRATLTNGDFRAEIPGFRVFGGRWSGLIGLDASGATPALNVDFQGQSVVIETLLRTLAGVDMLTGTGGFSIDASASGASIADMMASLSGAMQADLGDGEIKGLDLGNAVSVAQQALSLGGVQNTLSATGDTPFSEFASAFTIRNGVANVDVMRLRSPVVTADGRGAVNIAAQTLDISLLVKSLQGEVGGVDVSNVQAPVKVSGTWASPSIGLDTSGLGQAAVDRFGGQITEQLDQRLGGEVGGLLSEALGVQRNPAPAAEPEAPAEDNEDPAEDAPPPTVEETVEGLARDALGGLFGQRRD